MKKHRLTCLFILILAGSILIPGCKEKKRVVNNSIDSVYYNGKDSCTFNGVSLTSPSKPAGDEWADAVRSETHANISAVIPFALGVKDKPVLRFNEQGQWWGEKPSGVRTLIRQAKKHNLQVMIKPQVWFHNLWPGAFDLASPEDWNIWEQKYTEYILTYAQIAEEEAVTLFCIGTEFKNSAVKRNAYWSTLIVKVRKIYTGRLIYAANWDNYENIPFWKELDFIGIDAYFPLVNDEVPKLNELKQAWKPIAEKIHLFSDKQNRRIIFTEYGYRSMTYPAWNSWEKDNNYKVDVSQTAQMNAYQAIFEMFWGKPWFAGGFLWKWYTYDIEKPESNTDYTPQGKPVLEVIKRTYKETDSCR